MAANVDITRYVFPLKISTLSSKCSRYSSLQFLSGEYFYCNRTEREERKIEANTQEKGTSFDTVILLCSAMNRVTSKARSRKSSGM